MSTLRRIVLVRHGETEGNSSLRFYGSTDVPLSEMGRAQMRALVAQFRAGPFRGEPFDLYGASPLSRSWESAWILSDGAPVRLFADFAEIPFGRWEGLSAEEIRASDPVRFGDWQNKVPGFEFPGGEARAVFRARVVHGLARLQAEPVHSALLVLHKGVIRTIAEQLTRQELPVGEPALASVIVLTREAGGPWFRGLHSSNPPALVSGDLAA